MCYVPLWCRSHFSFLHAAGSPEDLVSRAAEYGLPAVALTDRASLSGVVRAHTATRALRAAATQQPGHAPKRSCPRLIVGAEIETTDGTSLALLARTREGYGRLCRLITTIRLRSAKGQWEATAGDIAEHAEGLTAIWTTGFADAPSHTVGLLREAFGGHLFAAIARHRLPEERDRERLIRAHALEHRVPCVAAPQVLYPSRENRPLYEILRCIDLGTTIHQIGTRVPPNAEYALRCGEEIARLYRDIPEALEQSLQIAGECRFSLDELVYRYPTERVPEGYTTGGWLRRVTLEGARERYRGEVPTEVSRQLEKELALIEELDYCGYFLTMYEIVNFCRERGILCQGRGSAANSAVCFCLRITAIDPVRMGLLFERFLSRERAEPPDIDLDIEHNRREEVIQHLYQSYGRDRAAMVANVIRYRPKSAVREVGKALGLPATDLDRIARMVSHRSTALPEILHDAGLDPEAPLHRLLIELSREILDTPRHLSIHPGGFLLGSDPVIELVPVENAAMEERTVIQWDKYDVEALGLFKVDLLGLGALTHLTGAFALLKRHYGLDLSMARIPARDDAVFDMLCRGDTIGVFQIESRAQMSMLPRLRPREFYDLVIEISIVRPGPITGGMVHPYLRRRNGEEDVHYPHPDLIPVLRKTLGVPLFQEQVMKLAVIAADYTPGEADQLRRDMAAWRRSGAIEKHGETIISRMTAKGIEREFAQAVFDQIRGFGEYGFPESHAASFALIAWCTAWLRHHYPAVFACALLNAWPMGFYAPATIVEDAKRRGVTVLPVDAVRSDWECTLEGSEAAIRMGLRYVKGLSIEAWEQIRRARAGMPGNLSAFLSVARLDEKSLSALAESGALSAFGVSRRQALWEVLGSNRRRSVKGRGADGNSTDRSNTDWSMAPPGDDPEFRPLDETELIRWNYRRTRHSADGHPMAPLRAHLRGRSLPSAADVAAGNDGSTVSFVGLVICRQRPSTAGGTLFLTLEDETGFVNVIVWKGDFRRHRVTLLTQVVLGVTGTLQRQDGVVHLILRSCWSPKVPGGAPAVASHDFH